jgi:hypothetical protein
MTTGVPLITVIKIIAAVRTIDLSGNTVPHRTPVPLPSGPLVATPLAGIDGQVPVIPLTPITCMMVRIAVWSDAGHNNHTALG